MSSTTSTTSSSLPDPIKVTIIEDQRTIREGLAALIDGTEGFRCAGSYGSMEEALKKMGPNAPDTEAAPDVALLDIGLPGMSGIEGAGVLRARYPAMPVLILTVYKDDERIFKAICAGARGYLLKKTPAARRCRPKSLAACSNSSTSFILPRTSITTLRHTNCDC